MNEHETEFQDLIEQLGKERPLAPEPNQAFTTGLRGRLLGNYDQNIGQGIGRLATTATALAILALVVFVGWFLNSSQQQQTIAGDAIQITRVVETADTTSFESISFEKGFQLTGFTLMLNPPESDPGTVQLAIEWHSANQITDNGFSSYGGWLHIVNERGKLGEVFGGLEWQPMDGGSVAHLDATVGLPNGRYSIYAGIYDQSTGKNLLNDNGEDMVLLDTFVIEVSGVPANDVIENKIPFGDNVTLFYNHVIQEATSDLNEVHILRFLWYSQGTPTENLVSFVHLLNENGQVVQQQDQALAWTVATGQMMKPGFTEYALQSVEVDLPDGRYQVQTGLYDGSTGQRITTTEATVQGETAVPVDTIIINSAPTEADWLNAVKLQSVQQMSRTATSNTIQVEAVISYDLTGLPEGEYVVKLHYAAPDWEENLDGRSPIDRMSDYLPLTETQRSLTITFSGNPQEMQSIADTDKPVLVLMLGQFNQPNGGQRLDTLSTITYSSYPLDLATTEAITYTIP